MIYVIDIYGGIYMKKILCGLLSGVLLLGSAQFAFAEKTFVDFSREDYDWAYDQVMNMVDQGYITGYEDNTFKPDNGVTRLEVLALFSRAMGALKEENADLLTDAVETYKDLLKGYDLPWGQKEISFLLYRGILTEDDLNTYLEDDLKNEPMPRYEAAIIITKAMGGKKPSGSQAITLDFTDQEDIPVNALYYVKYVSDNGIMTGMEDGEFSPNTSVLRTQMAVMLNRVIDKTAYEFVTGKLQEIDLDGRILAYYDAEGNLQKNTYLDSVVMKTDGIETSPKNMIVGVEAIITLTDNKVAYVDTLSSIPDETVSGIFQSRTTRGDVTEITVKDAETGAKSTHECSATVSVTYNGEPSTLTNFKLNDYIVLELENGVVERVSGETKTTTVALATVEEISLDPFTMTISHANEEYDGATYPISDDVTVNKNSDSAQFSDILIGDKVTLTLTYGVITGVKATSSTKTQNGVIREIKISQSPTITVNAAGEDVTYAVGNDVQITVNGEKGTLYDFRVGDSVKLTLESQTVVKISSTTAQSASGKLEGTITAVNSAYGFIKVTHLNDDGYSVEETVYCKDTTTSIMDAAGKTKKLKDLKVGDIVNAHGTISNGAFTAKVIIVS